MNSTEAPELNYQLEQAADQAQRDTREYLGRYLQGMSRQEIMDCLADSPLAVTAGPTINKDFLAGFALAAELVRDQNFDY